MIQDGFYAIECFDSLDIRTVRHLPKLDQLERMPISDELEIIDVDSRKDSVFAEYISIMKEETAHLPMDEQVEILAEFVCHRMGGVIKPVDIGNYDYKSEIQAIKNKCESNVLSIGSIVHGFFNHRALLFKALADRCGIPCSLYRGNHCRAWNGVILFLDDNEEEGFIVDLIHEPGKLLLLNGNEARVYQQL